MSRFQSDSKAPSTTLRPTLGWMASAAAVLPLLASTTAFAKGGEAAGGHGGAHVPHVANWWHFGAEWAHAPALGWMFVTFLTFCGIVIYFVRTPLSDFLQTRSDAVRNALAEAQEARADAEAKARDYETRLARLDDEVASLRQEFTDRGAAEAKRLEEVGEQTAIRIARDAEETIAAESERAQIALASEAARLAISLAEKKITVAASAADDARLHTAFLSDLSSSAEA